MIDLLDRYLAAVARQLPERQKADVTAELRDELLSKIEEREEALGRPLTRNELEALLIDFGHPVAVAGRYRRFQHLIGPEVYPYWWAALKLTLGFVVAVYVIVGGIAAVGGAEAQAVTGKISDNLFVAVIFTFGLVTAFCAGVERFGKVAILQQWKPRDLPPVKTRGRGRFDIVAEVVVGVVMIAWWMGLVSFNDVTGHLLRTVDLKVVMAQVWRDLWWPILGYMVFELAINLVALARPAWAGVNGALRIVRNLAGAALVVALLPAGRWIDLAGLVPPDATSVTQATVDRAMHLGIAAVGLVFLGMAIWEAWRLRQYLVAARSPALARAA